MTWWPQTLTRAELHHGTPAQQTPLRPSWCYGPRNRPCPAAGRARLRRHRPPAPRRGRVYQLRHRSSAKQVPHRPQPVPRHRRTPRHRPAHHRQRPHPLPQQKTSTGRPPLHQRPAARLERSLILCTALMRAAALDLNEQGDVWARVLQHRAEHLTRPPTPDARAWEAFTGDIRRLLLGTARTTGEWHT